MTDSRVGDLVLVPFPFADLSTSRKRPALILARIPFGPGALYVVAMVTSRVDSEKIPGDLLIEKWREAGLLHPSKVRLSKLVSLEEELLLKKLGSLPRESFATVGRHLKKVFSGWEL